jgi:hypothetical protein
VGDDFVLCDAAELLGVVAELGGVVVEVVSWGRACGISCAG